MSENRTNKFDFFKVDPDTTEEDLIQQLDEVLLPLRFHLTAILLGDAKEQFKRLNPHTVLGFSMLIALRELLKSAYILTNSILKNSPYYEQK